jgi:aminoglycoside phosphotransferase (APT) family kinase protein
MVTDTGSSRPWDGEVEITVEQAGRLIASQFPAIGLDSVSMLGSGWDNVAVLLNEEIVFRFPKKAAAVTLIETEARILPELAAHQLPLQIPVPEWIGEPSDAYPWPFIGYRRLPGRLGCQARLSVAARKRNAPILGEFLACLHAVRANAMDLPGDVLNRRDFVQRMPLMVERLEVLRSHGMVASPEPWLKLFGELEHIPPTSTDVVVHGDLYARHLLVNDHDRLTGIIDWGDVHRGDPAMDLMLMYGFLPGSARAEFEAAYGAVDESERRVARLRAAFHAVSISWYGLELPDPDLASEGRKALAFVLEP